MVILLTGATGFLGSHLLKKFLENKQEIVILKRSFSDTSRILDELSNIKSYDIDKIDLEDIFKENRISAIIHTATDYGKTKESIADLLETNLIFPIKLIDYAIKYGVEIFINTDTYFSKDGINYNYLSNYSMSKKLLRTYLKSLNGKIKVVNAIIEHLYGEKDRDDKFVTQMIKKIAKERVEQIDLTLGEQKKDFIYVDDVANAYIKILKYARDNTFDFKSFDIGYGTSISIKDFVKAIKDISQSPTQLNFGAIPYREDEIMCFKSDNQTLLDIGWKPKYSYIDGISKVIQWENKNV